MSQIRRKTELRKIKKQESLNQVLKLAAWQLQGCPKKNFFKICQNTMKDVQKRKNAEQEI